MNKKTFLYIFIGILIGVGLTLGTVYYAINDYIIEDYSDDAATLADILETSKDPVLQKNYVLAGLTLSSDFQEYLEYGVQNGWWTEEFLAQVLIDDVIPVYIAQYGGTITLILSTESAENLKIKIDDLKTFVAALPVDTISAVINRLLAISLPDIDGLQQKLVLLGEARIRLVEVIEDLRATISDLEQKIPQLQEKIDNLKEKLAELQNVEENIQDKVDELQVIIQNIKDKVDDLETIIQNIKDKFEDVDPDHEFLEGENTILGATFTLTGVQAKILNALDITIVVDSYDNGGTPVVFEDDILVIGQIYIGLESGSGPGIDIVVGNVTIESKLAWLINSNIDMINNFI